MSHLVADAEIHSLEIILQYLTRWSKWSLQIMVDSFSWIGKMIFPQKNYAVADTKINVLKQK
jgi:hypothetical protein